MNTDHDLLDRLQAFVKAESKDWFNVGTGQLDHTEVSPAGKLVKEALDRLSQYQPVERVAQAIRAVNSDTEGLSYTELTTAMAMAAIAARLSRSGGQSGLRELLEGISYRGHDYDGRLLVLPRLLR